MCPRFLQRLWNPKSLSFPPTIPDWTCASSVVHLAVLVAPRGPLELPLRVLEDRVEQRVHDLLQLLDLGAEPADLAVQVIVRGTLQRIHPAPSAVRQSAADLKALAGGLAP